MFPTKDTGIYAGDVYIFQDDAIVGMVGQIKFRRVPRLLMDQFFSPPDMKKNDSGQSVPKHVALVSAPAVPQKETRGPKSAVWPEKPNAGQPAAKPDEKAPKPVPELAKAPVKEEAAPAIAESNPVVADCLRLIADETGL